MSARAKAHNDNHQSKLTAAAAPVTARVSTTGVIAKQAPLIVTMD
ncbi:MAG: hypothetical protein WBO07_00025 [Formosimonas sp.]